MNVLFHHLNINALSLNHMTCDIFLFIPYSFRGQLISDYMHFSDLLPFSKLFQTWCLKRGSPPAPVKLSDDIAPVDI